MEKVYCSEGETWQAIQWKGDNVREIQAFGKNKFRSIIITDNYLELWDNEGNCYKGIKKNDYILLKNNGKKIDLSNSGLDINIVIVPSDIFDIIGQIKNKTDESEHNIPELRRGWWDNEW